MLRLEVNLPISEIHLDASRRPRVEPWRVRAPRHVATSARRLVVAGALVITACGGVKIRSPIARGSEPVAPAPSGPPATFVRSTSDTKSTRMVDVREGLKKDQLFKAASDMLAEKYSVDVADPRAGFLMTTWQSSVVRDGVPDLRYRTRIIIRFVGEEWKQASVRAEANWQHGEEWEVGYDVGLLEAVTAELKSRLGKRVN